MKTVAVVLAGGASSRFGSEKAAALLEGRPLVAHVAAALGAGSEAVAVNARPDSAAAAWAQSQGLELVPDDPRRTAGPLRGVRAALAWGESRGAALVATAPCDTPNLPADLVLRLRAEIGERPGAVAADAQGALHPLCALWRPALLQKIDRLLDDPKLPPMRRLVTDLGFAVVRIAEPEALANINSPAELQGRARSSPGTPSPGRRTAPAGR